MTGLHDILLTKTKERRIFYKQTFTKNKRRSCLDVCLDMNAVCVRLKNRYNYRISLALLLERVVNVVSLLFVRILAERVDGLAVVPLSVSYVLGRTHNGHVELSVTSANVIPVYEVNVSELTAVKNAVLDGHRFASAKEHAAEMSVGVHGGEVTGLVYVSTELSVDRAGMTVLMLFSKIGDHLSHDVEQVVLEILEIEGIDVVRALLDHHGAGGVVRCDGDRTVLDTGSQNI